MTEISVIRLTLLFWISCLLSGSLYADPLTDESVPLNEKPSAWKLNFKTKTIGGKQFWTDIRMQSGWRIQQNIYTKHFRVLDSKNYRHAWGTRKQCDATFERFLAAGEIQPFRKRVIILLHGLARTRSSMDRMQKHLQGQIVATVLNMTYASTRDSLEQHATALHSVLKHIPKTCEISFVCHSLGNIVVRRFLHMQQDPRITRIVMLAPPNQGTALGTLFQDNDVFETVWGTSGKQMTTAFTEVQRMLAIPTCEFAIISGTMENHLIQNRLLQGENDLVLTVKETLLSGAADFRTLNSTHTRIMIQPKTLQWTTRFLQRGYFETPQTTVSIK
ncbi:MAG: hypothetical protein VX738_10770 [Planctomycetota bacterium]|nr:hypothetical protein [Planctomycetota bacterium]